MSDFRIWFGSLAAYNEGVICGEWVDLPADEDKLREVFNKYTHSGAHDFYIADWELPFDIGEYEDVFKLNEIIERYDNLLSTQQEAFNYLVAYENLNFDEALDKVDEVIFYPCRTFKELAMHFVDDGMLGEIPDRLYGYLDFEAIGRDLSFEGCYALWEDQIAEYRN